MQSQRALGVVKKYFCQRKRSAKMGKLASFLKFSFFFASASQLEENWLVTASLTSFGFFSGRECCLLYEQKPSDGLIFGV